MNDHHDRPPCENFDADAFVDGVLGRTTGQACGRAIAQLDALMSDRLHGTDRQLVQAHLHHCAGCRNLAITLGWLNPLLPQMAEINPGPGFVAGVLARTTQAQRPVVFAEHPTGLAGWLDRIGRWWEQRIVRPQFALQVAYVATVLLVLLTATPRSPLRGAPSQALAVVTAGPQTAPVIGPVVNRAAEWLESQASVAVSAGRRQVRGRWQGVETSLARRAARTTTGRVELRTLWREAMAQARARDLGGTGCELLAALRAGRGVWDQWWIESEATSEP